MRSVGGGFAALPAFKSRIASCASRSHSSTSA